MQVRTPTQEIAKNPRAETKVRCKVCEVERALGEVLMERPLPAPNNTVTEIFIRCPDCGTETHSCYLPERLRYMQVRLQKALLEWQQTQTRSAYRQYKDLQRKFQIQYDSAQRKYGVAGGERKDEQPEPSQD